jgi:hypothetical protein
LATAAAAVHIKPSLRLADRMKFQDEMIRDRKYKIIGRLTAVLFEAQRSTKGLSQSRPRYANAAQSQGLPASLVPFSSAQAKLWSSVTLDWLTHKDAPIIAISSDLQDLLLPSGMVPLPDIPDPRWTPKTAGELAPRIPQLLTGCPVVGDRVRDKLTDRNGRVYGVLHPIKELQVMLMGAIGTFARIRATVDAEGTHMALLIDDSNPERLQGYFVGGKFQFGG